MSSRKKQLSMTSTHDLKTYDLFQLTPFLSVGEPYLADKDSILKDTRSKGRQLQITPQKSGVLNDSTFGPFLSLATTEPYQPYKDFQRANTAGKRVSEKPFIPSNPTKKLTGPGDTHGCFNPLEYMGNGGLEGEMGGSRAATAGRTSRASTSHSTTRKRSYSGSPTKGSSTTRGRGFGSTTSSGDEFLQPPFRPSSPNKKGIYGTFSPFPEYMGSGTDNSILKARQKKIKVPFRSMSPPLRGWDMSVYRPTTSPKPSRPKSSRGPSIVQPPFRPSSPNKKGLYGTFSPYPEYIAGADLKEKSPKPASARTEKTKVFMPTGAFSTNTPQPSILAMAARSQP